jgi:hypothetical protein
MLRRLVKRWLFEDEKPTVVHTEKTVVIENHHHHYADGRTTTRQDGAHIPGSAFIDSLKEKSAQ